MNPELGVIGNIDIGSEQNFIGGLLQHGFKAWADIADIVQPSTLVQHSEIYKIIDYTFKTHGNIVLDNPTLINGANALGLNDYIYDKNQRKYLDGLKNANVDINNIKVLGTKLRKLEVTRQLRSEIAKADAELDKINGDERLSEIMSKVESPLADFSQYLRGIDKNGPELILKNLGKYLDELESNPVEQIGVSTGFKLWDASIGGGLIPGSVNLIGARPKMGKSSLADNMAYNIIHQGIDCLMLDAEMHEKQHYNRLLAKISKVSVNEIKTGQYSLNEIKKEKVRLAQKVLEVLPYHYLNISGQPFEETMAEAQRWILNKVKLNSKGKANPCVIVLDYLKMMSEKEMAANVAEFQKLGFMSSAFINFAIKYEIPCLSFLQLNREGIKSEETSVFAGSDRILMHLSSASIFKAQSDEEIQKQRENGSNIIYNRKIVCKVAREGEGHEDGDYVNIRFNRETCDLQEGPNFFSMSNPQNRNTGDIVPNNEEIDF